MDDGQGLDDHSGNQAGDGRARKAKGWKGRRLKEKKRKCGEGTKRQGKRRQKDGMTGDGRGGKEKGRKWRD